MSNLYVFSYYFSRIVYMKSLSLLLRTPRCFYFWINIYSAGKSLSEALIFASTNPQYVWIMMTDCALNYKFNAWKFQAQTWREHVVYRYCFWHPEQILYTTNTEIPAIWNPSYLLTLFYRTPFNNNVQTRNPKISNGPNIRFPNRDAVIPAVRRRRIDWLCSTGHHSMTIYGSSSLLWWPRALLWRAFFVIPHTPPILKP